MPGWHEQTRDLQESGKLQLVGLIQEQHPQRCALFMQWKRMQWPILVDSLNRTDVHKVPLYWAVDEHGVLRKVSPTPRWVREEFVNESYPASEPAEVESPAEADRLFLQGEWTEAIAAYRTRIEHDAKDSKSWFRLACSYRARHDSEGRQPGDFQQAIDAWTMARSLEPRNYIFRRRIEQYGPRLAKPYPFYDWIVAARRDIAARGEEALVLRCEPEGSELAARIRRFETADASAVAPDEADRLPPDAERLVRISTVVAPKPIGAGESARLYLRFTPDRKRKVTWDNEAGPLRVWLNAPDGWRTSQNLLTATSEKGASSNETRSLEVEVASPRTAELTTHQVEGYALYYVCDGPNGECTFLRQDFRIRVPLVKSRARRSRRRR